MVYYRLQTKFAKVVFTGVCSGGGACMAGRDMHGRGACVAGGMHGRGACVAGGGVVGAYMAGGGMHGRGACIAGGGVCVAGGHAWHARNPPPPGRYYEIR